MYSESFLHILPSPRCVTKTFLDTSRETNSLVLRIVVFLTLHTPLPFLNCISTATGAMRDDHLQHSGDSPLHPPPVPTANPSHIGDIVTSVTSSHNARQTRCGSGTTTNKVLLPLVFFVDKQHLEPKGSKPCYEPVVFTTGILKRLATSNNNAMWRSLGPTTTTEMSRNRS
jgi:hypothetical protein